MIAPSTPGLWARGSLVLALAALLAIAMATGGCAAPPPDRCPTLVLWHSYTGAEQEALEDVVAELNRQSGCDATGGVPGGGDRTGSSRIVLVQVPSEAFADKLTNAIPNGNGPDLFIYPGQDRLGDWVSAGLVEPIEYYVPVPVAERFQPAALTSLAYHGSLYGLPLAVKSVALYYRTDLLARPPATTDELMAIGRRMTHGDHFALVYDNSALYGHAPWLFGFGGRLFDRSGRVSIDTPGAVAAARFAARLGGNGGIVPRGMNGQLVATLFNTGKAAMAISGPWFQTGIQKGVPWKLAPLPLVSATGRPAEPFLGAEGVFLSSRAHHKAAAYRVMEALSSDRSAILRARRAHQVVPNLAAYREPDLAADPVLAAFRAQAEHSVPMPTAPAMRMIWTPYKIALEKIIGQGADPERALAAAQREIRGYTGGAGGT